MRELATSSIFDVLTAREAEQQYGLSPNTVVVWISRKKFHQEEHRKSSGTWLVTRAGMERITGGE
ncbi:DNA-binding protein [Bacillus sp. AFS075034]|nr:DNA-binding protein [Bacillus sp. AFS075034]